MPVRAQRATPFSRHVANRFSYGWTPALQRQIDRAGGPRRWFEQQLDPESVPDRFYEASRDWWPSNSLMGPPVWRRSESGVEKYWVATFNYQRWALARRIHGNRQVLEVMADFWENHLHVPSAGEAEAMYRADYGITVRRHALGDFATLLHEAITHPSMGCYLNNAQSTRQAPNEDLGRELLEVHTVGRGHYDEDDVKASARILTGYRVNVWRDWTWGYDPDSHWTGPVRVMDFTDPNASRDGRAVTRRYLHYLATHPATARRLARKLAVHFVSDDPSEALVEHLASVYLAHDTAIKPVLRAIVDSDEFRRSKGTKVRTPDEDVVATYRRLGSRLHRPTNDSSAANAILWQARMVGHAPFTWPRPDGRPDRAEAWSSTARMLASFEVHYVMSGGWWPRQQVRHRPHHAWLPRRRIRFRHLVDHLSRAMLGRPADQRLLTAAVRATGCRPNAWITRRHGLVRWYFPRLLATVLDTPEHMSR